MGCVLPRARCQQPQHQFQQVPANDLKSQCADVTEQLDHLTYLLQEGKSSDGHVLDRPHCMIAMFVGVRILDFPGHWIEHTWCVGCPCREAARCCRCQAGICENCGLLLNKAARDGRAGEWKGASQAICKNRTDCENRQDAILAFWKQHTD